MNILFLTTGRMESIEQHAIYPDLLRFFRDNGHQIYTVSSYEKRTGKNTELIEDHGVKMLHVKTGNLTKTNIIEKGVSTLLIETKYMNAIKKYFGDTKFDLLIYSTPPITLVKVIDYIKKRDKCRSYLLLKDIFPQNAVDLGILSKFGFKGILYRYFRSREKELYAISDRIGCMSQENVNYITKNNPELDSHIVEVCPNCIDIIDTSISDLERHEIRNKYNIPLEKKVFVYGGNLGKPQGIPFLIKCLEEMKNDSEVFFLIIGDGTEYEKINDYISEFEPNNVKLIKSIPKVEYDSMVGACDVGMIFLDYRFTIPNFPSRILAYMQANIPILAVTDTATDIGRVIIDGGFGWWSPSNNVELFKKNINEIKKLNLEKYKVSAFEYLEQHYSTKKCYEIIMKKM